MTNSSRFLLVLHTFDISFPHNSCWVGITCTLANESLENNMPHIRPRLTITKVNNMIIIQHTYITHVIRISKCRIKLALYDICMNKRFISRFVFGLYIKQLMRRTIISKGLTPNHVELPDLAGKMGEADMMTY